ncbi:MAG: lysophospholipid acyltransferase family protein [Xanthomonadaceae bacterium]|nr:lysophospholipid acyltransferase family protein [Xanthomonadaceae bacterium]MDP2186881.1 lysophospholipid acyltransferase family protein [Xanthomonadales bacterium]MDZ4114914.1 lysophospholipid acyltransferase family protein [Xanthomonadaceae bacterium]MDZ4377468.1 lysophospholipid acyltransferase family protein [Xanthomonadaceae bacterium]
MISVEKSFYSKFPGLADGRRRALSKPVVDLLRRVIGEEQVNQIIRRLHGYRGFDFVDHGLLDLGARYRVEPTDIENIPAEGRVVIVANHPLGAVDALCLLQLVGRVRCDVRILANDYLLQLDGLAPLLVPCDVFGGKPRAQLREAYRCLQREEAVIIFPAGEVSRIHANGIRDQRWLDGFLRIARKTGAPVVPIHIAARNSPTFYGVSLLAKPLGTLLLAREMFAVDKPRMDITIGAPIPASALTSARWSDAALARRMRAHVYRLPRRKPPMFTTSSAVAHAEPAVAVRDDLAGARCLGQTADGKQILLLESGHDGAAMREIGRLRELTFRKVGEGTGLKRDLDRYDAWYSHIVLWDALTMEIVGAYRLGESKTIINHHGLDGLYSNSLFEFTTDAQAMLAQSVELGRSFVHPRHWGSRSLDYLWQGIGAYLRVHPHIRYLIGPVSLSASLGESARGWIVHYHQHFYGDTGHTARARNPYRVPADIAADATAAWHGQEIKASLLRLRSELLTRDATLPVLYKQYVDLCPPEGIRFLAFGIDPAFGHCVDGLIRIDLDTLKPAKRARYLGG